MFTELRADKGMIWISTSLTATQGCGWPQEIHHSPQASWSCLFELDSWFNHHQVGQLVLALKSLNAGKVGRAAQVGFEIYHG